MPNPPVVSVLMSVYNGERYLVPAVQSILDQTFRDFEFVIIDDGSTDHSALILDGFASRDSRIRVIHQANAGLTVSLNRGLHLCQGGLIARMDADDVALPKRFECQVAFLEKNPECIAIGTQSLAIDGDGDPINDSRQPLDHQKIDGDHIIGIACRISHPTMMIRRDALLKINGYCERFETSQDYDLLLRLGEIGRLANVPESLLLYRLHDSNVSVRRRQQQVRDVSAIVTEARERRGLPPLAAFEPEPDRPSRADDERIRDVIWMSINNRFRKTARKHALNLVRSSPWRLGNWYALLMAIIESPDNWVGQLVRVTKRLARVGGSAVRPRPGKQWLSTIDSPDLPSSRSAEAISGLPPSDPANTESAQMTADDVKEKTIAGIKSLSFRTIVTLGMRVISSLIMARLLFAEDYGVFAVAAWIVGIGGFLSDVGLAGALVRQHTVPTRDEAYTVFIAQQIMTAVIVVLVILAGPSLAGVSQVTPAQRAIVYVMAINLFSSSLRVIPLLMLERDLKFKTIAHVELLQSIVNTGLNILLAWRGWGPWALAVGSVAGAITFTVGVWMASPWKPHGNFQFAIVKRLARFGVAFQLNALVPTLLSGWIPILGGRILGITAVGLVNWATSISSVPLMLSAILNRVAFPAYARIQNDAAMLGVVLEGTVRRLLAVMTMVVPVAILLCPMAIPILFKARWVPAVPLVQWFSLEVMLATVLGILAAAQNAIGFSADRLWIALGAGILRWIVGYVVIKELGLTGIGPTVVLITLCELAGTAWMLRWRNPACARLPGTVFVSLVRLGAMIAVAWELALLVPEDHIYVRSLVSVGLFTLILSTAEILTGGKMVLIEIRAIVRMVRTPRSTEPSLVPSP